MYAYISAIAHLHRLFEEQRNTVEGARYFYRAWNIAFLLTSADPLLIQKELLARTKALMAYERAPTLTHMAKISHQIQQDYSLIVQFIEQHKLSEEVFSSSLEEDMRDDPLSFGWAVKE